MTLVEFLARVNQHQLPLLDARSYASFCQGHIATSAHLPFEQWSAGRHALPANGWPLAVVTEASQQDAVQHWLIERGFDEAPVLQWQQGIASQLQELQRLEIGANEVRLWQPAPLLQSYMSALPNSSPQNPLQALDLGCGNGRDAVFLALHGWRVTAVDYLAGALTKCAWLASHHQVDVHTALVDIEQQFERLLELGPFGLVCVVRYLNRDLLRQLDKLLLPGGYLLYQTFTEAAAAFGKPKNPRFLLRPGELATTFSDYRLVLDSEQRLPDGRPVSAFIAQKPQ